MTRAAKEKSACAKAVKVIEAGLRGDQDLLAVCRELVRLRRNLPNSDGESMMTIVAVESELDDIPAPDQYGAWNESALNEKLAERDEYLGRVRESLEGALKSLLGRFKEVLAESVPARRA